MKQDVADRRSALGLASFLGLTLLLALAVPFSRDHARANQPLTHAVKALLN